MSKRHFYFDIFKKYFSLSTSTIIAEPAMSGILLNTIASFIGIGLATDAMVNRWTFPHFFPRDC